MSLAMQDVRSQIHTSQERNNEQLLSKIEALFSPSQPNQVTIESPQPPPHQLSLSQVTPDHQVQLAVANYSLLQTRLALYQSPPPRDIVTKLKLPNNINKPSKDITTDAAHDRCEETQRPQSRGTAGP